MAEKSARRRASVVAEHTVPGVEMIAGLTFDGENVWVVDYKKKSLVAVEPATGRRVRELAVPCDAGTAFDGEALYQLGGELIRKVDPHTGKVLGSIPAPGGGKTDSGLAWADGALWVGQHSDRKIFKIDPKTGKVLKTITSDRFVTGVTWVDGELWHGTHAPQDTEEVAELRHVDADTGDVLETIELPKGQRPNGMEGDREGRLWVGDMDGKLRAVKRKES